MSERWLGAFCGASFNSQRISAWRVSEHEEISASNKGTDVEIENQNGEVIGTSLFFHCQQLSAKSTGKAFRAGLHRGWQVAAALAYSASSRAKVCIVDHIDVTLLMVPGDLRKISHNKISSLSSNPALKINKLYNCLQPLPGLSTEPPAFSLHLNSSPYRSLRGHVFYDVLSPKGFARTCVSVRVYIVCDVQLGSLWCPLPVAGDQQIRAQRFQQDICTCVGSYVCSGGTMLQIKGKTNL